MQNTAAYDLSLFDNRQPKIVPLENNKKARHAKQKRSIHQKFLNGAFATIMVLAGISIVFFMIFSRVRLTEMNSKINELDEQLGILQSENVRLNNELCGIASADKIEEYANANGLQKMESNQIEYFTVEAGDRIEKSSSSEGFLSSLGIHVGKKN